jgi:hypothetical protein
VKGYERHERHLGDWHEWSVGTGDSIEKGKPARLFVRAGDAGLASNLIVVTNANVTSFAPTAQQLTGESGAAEILLLSRDEVKFLLEVLPLVVAALDKFDAEADEEPKP